MPAGAQETVELGRGGEGGSATIRPLRAARSTTSAESGADSTPSKDGQPSVGDRAASRSGRVAGDPAGDAPDPFAPEDPDEAVQVGACVRVGSPKPFRIRRALPRAADAAALAEHLGRPAVGGAELDERGVGDESFSFEAGSSDRSGLRAKTTRPVGSSTTIAVDEAEITPGTRKVPGEPRVQAAGAARARRSPRERGAKLRLRGLAASPRILRERRSPTS